MPTLVTGLDEARSRAYFGEQSWQANTLDWAPPGSNLATRSDQHIVWLYQAPWKTPETEPQAGLDTWLHHQRHILGQRARLGQSLVLVNIDRIRADTLLAHLSNQAHSEPATTRSSALDATLALLFEQAAPQYWDVYEDLEACSWLCGDEPQFRSHADLTDTQLQELLQVLAQVASANLQAGQLKEKLAHAQHSIQQHAQANSKLTDENKLLLQQLHQTQEELETRYIGSQDKAQQLSAELEKAKAAQLASSNKLAELEKQLDQAKQAARQHTQTNSELADENKLLLLQLHQVQEELEAYYLKNLELDKTLANERKAAQTQLRTMQDEVQQATKPAVSVATGTPASNSVRARLAPRSLRNVVGRSRSRKLDKARLEAIRKSEWFDRNWYLQTYPDLQGKPIDPLEHYFFTGWKENRNPSAGFDTAYYLRCNPDITQSGLNPLWHFVQFGQKEGRLPHKP